MTTLESLVKEKYSIAKDNGNLFIFETRTVKKEAGGVQFEINYAPTLAQKPIDEYNKKMGSTGDRKHMDPFLSPDPALLIQESNSHRILLNKFCVIPHQLLITTKEYQSQSLPLSPSDMLIGWKTLMTAFGPSSPGMLFYNCGPHSGASQEHKHMQVIPLIGPNIQPPIQKAINNIENSKAGEIYTLDQLPFIHVLTPLDRDFLDCNNSDDAVIEAYLGQMFFGLLDTMFQQQLVYDLNSGETDTNNKSSSPSFNFVITSTFMLLVPRRQEKGKIGDDGVTIALNALCFAGYILAQTEKENQMLLKLDNIMDLILQVAFPRSVGLSSSTAQTEGILTT